MKTAALALSLFAVLPLSTVGPDDGALERALDAVDPDHIEADLRFIASDELQGRDTPSQGLRMAARFIRARLERLGFTPAGDEGGFFHHYRMQKTMLDQEASGAWIDRDGEATPLTFGEDYYFFRGVAPSDVKGEVVFVGPGVEVEGIDLTGKWALALDTATSMEQAQRLAGERSSAVRAAGAAGLIVASPLDGQDQHGPRRGRMVASFLGRGSMRVLVGDESAEEDVWPQLYVSARVAENLLRGITPEVGTSLDVTFHEERVIQPGEEPVLLENVAGFWPGSHPELSREVLIVSAHYDHVGVEDGEIYNGADDNGSGTCGMLAIAEALAAYGPLERSVLLLWVSGEEKGLRGSYAWTMSPSLPAGYRPAANLNIDMIGRNAPDYLLVTPSPEHPAYSFLTKMAEKHGVTEGFPELGSADEYWQRSDHMNFSENLGIPVAFLFSDVHADYHQPTDTVEKIDYDKISRVTRMVVRMLDELQTEPLGP